jgi:hypothetical protein
VIGCCQRLVRAGCRGGPPLVSPQAIQGSTVSVGLKSRQTPYDMSLDPKDPDGLTLPDTQTAGRQPGAKVFMPPPWLAACTGSHTGSRLLATGRSVCLPGAASPG